MPQLNSEDAKTRRRKQKLGKQKAEIRNGGMVSASLWLSAFCFPHFCCHSLLPVFALLYSALLAGCEDLTQRRRGTQRFAESSSSLRFSAFLCTAICEDLRSPRKFSWPHVTFATHVTHLTFWLRLGRAVSLRLCCSHPIAEFRFIRIRQVQVPPAQDAFGCSDELPR